VPPPIFSSTTSIIMVSWHFLTFHRTFGACPCSPSGHVPLHYPRRIIGYASAKVGHGYNMLHVHFVCIHSQSAAACSTGSPSPNPSCPFRGTTVRVVKSFPEPVLPCKQATLFPMGYVWVWLHTQVSAWVPNLSQDSCLPAFSILQKMLTVLRVVINV
jgi:hypothetical protein